MDISNKIKIQQNYLNEWKKKLEKKLLENASNETKDIYLFLISEKWLKKYVNFFFYKINNDNVYDSNLNNKYNKYELIDNNNLFNVDEFKELPNIFPLNDRCWYSLIRNNEKEKEIKIKANFYNHILIFDLNLKLNNINDRIYCFFFLDKNNIIMQSYIKINNKDKEEQIINCLKNYGPLKFIPKYINNNPEKNNYYKFDDFEMKIFESQNNINYMNIQTSVKNNYKICKINNSPQTMLIKIKKKDDKNKINQNNSNINLEKNEIREIPKKNNILPYFSENGGGSVLFRMKKNIEIENEMKPKRKIIPRNRKASAQIRVKKDDIFNNESPLLLNLFLPKAIHQESTPGIIGLVNIGPVPYMNAILQCFSNIYRLKTELLNKDIYDILENDKNTKTKLSFALAEVLKNLWENLKHRYFSPDEFKKVITELNPQIQEMTENKLINFISFLLETLHKELNSPIYNNNINNDNYILNHTNLNEVFNKFYEYYNNTNKSIISDEFNGFCDKMIICENCKNIYHNIDNYYYLSFNLEEVKQFVGYYNCFQVRISDCFDYNERYVFFSYSNCKNCGKYGKSYRQDKLLYIPHTLIINLDHVTKELFKNNIVFEEFLNLRNYIYQFNSPYNYELRGVITKISDNFIAYCKNINNNEWYKYDNEIVTPTSFNEIKANGFHYVLFYSYMLSG